MLVFKYGHMGKGQAGHLNVLCSQAQGEPPQGTEAVTVTTGKNKESMSSLWGLWEGITTGIRCEVSLQNGSCRAEWENVKDRLIMSGFVLKCVFLKCH